MTDGELNLSAWRQKQKSNFKKTKPKTDMLERTGVSEMSVKSVPRKGERGRESMVGRI